MLLRGLLIGTALVLGLALAATPALAQKRYDEGASDFEIRIGNTNPYSGNASAYGAIGKTIEAYFEMINEQGGINGRKITFISYDDGYSPPKTVEMVRKLVEEDKVLFVFQTLGTPSNSAIQKYLNQVHVPQLFVASGASKWGNPKEFPWTMGWQPDYVTEATIYAGDIVDNVKDARGSHLNLQAFEAEPKGGNSYLMTAAVWGWTGLLRRSPTKAISVRPIGVRKSGSAPGTWNRGWRRSLVLHSIENHWGIPGSEAPRM
jgi:hypothetical protein